MPALALALASLLVPCPVPYQDQGAQSSPVALLDELVERTNSLGSFRAVYQLHKGEELSVRFELAYAAPDRLLLTIDQEEGDERTTARSWVVGSALRVRVSAPDGSEVAGDVDFAHLPDPAGAVLRVLDERFGLEPGGLGAGPQVSLAWGVDPESDKAEFDLRIQYQAQDRSALLGWLEHMRRAQGQWSVDGQRVEWRRADERIVARLSRASGFLEHLRMVGIDEKVAELQLAELDLEPELADELFVAPPRGAAAEDMFPDPIRAAFGGLSGVRSLAYARVEGALARGLRSWDPALRQDWEQVVAALHESTLARVHEGMHAPVEERTVQMAAAVREQLAKAPPGDEAVRVQMLEQIREWRDGLVRSIDQEQTRYLDGIAAPGRHEDVSEHQAELHALEREQVVGIFEASVRAPLLALFDERLDEALGG